MTIIVTIINLIILMILIYYGIKFDIENYRRLGRKKFFSLSKDKINLSDVEEKYFKIFLLLISIVIIIDTIYFFFKSLAPYIFKL